MLSKSGQGELREAGIRDGMAGWPRGLPLGDAVTSGM